MQSVLTPSPPPPPPPSSRIRPYPSAPFSSSFPPPSRVWPILICSFWFLFLSVVFCFLVFLIIHSSLHLITLSLPSSILAPFGSSLLFFPPFCSSSSSSSLVFPFYNSSCIYLNLIHTDSSPSHTYTCIFFLPLFLSLYPVQQHP